MDKLLIILCLIVTSGCKTIATQNDDGDTTKEKSLHHWSYDISDRLHH